MGKDGKVVFEKAYGPADQEWDVPNTPKTKFRIASLTKQFTAACILILQERGLLHVQDPISKYMTGLPAPWKEVTVHQTADTHPEFRIQTTPASNTQKFNGSVLHRNS